MSVALAVAIGALAGLVLPGVAAAAAAGSGTWLRALRVARFAGTDWAMVVSVAAMWGALAAVIEPASDLLAFLYLAWVGVGLAAIDLRCYRLPDVLTLGSYPIAVALLTAAAVTDSSGGRLARSLAAGILLAVGYYLLAIARPGGLGFGDVKLAGLVGLYLGWSGWPVLLLGTLFAFLAGAIVAIGLMVTGRAARESRLPFGPFMLAGALAAILAA